ncbi:hypothetical protein CAPTEDRAFT_177458 [Capitella teleta]|uniref:SRR1-like domain-containing protein n=1 Tax=Capitella teleta TaxID=283909 RepID=R7V889_CAPTE|nr:hypothetical protein CAPTEDRAFT_177458 [Capitella teleta]|eukprot:ELU14749.1 hypothetical protein CAPTEDRAFT_177458 [Capitella teleta]
MEGLEEFLKTEFWKKLEGTIRQSLQRPVSEFVCYGIGSFALCLIARQQLLLALALRRVLKIPDEDAFIYDPLYAPSHNKFLETRLKFKIIDANEEGKRQVNSSTVFFMPHCGKPLYNNLLWRNWNIDSLSDMIIIGNSFNYMNDSTPRRILEEEAKYILKILDKCSEIQLENSFPQSDVFNNTSLHIFPRILLDKAPATLWKDCAEPEYADSVEIQLKSL